MSEAQTVAEARQSLRNYVEQMSHNPAIQCELSKRIAAFTAACVREERAKLSAFAPPASGVTSEWLKTLDVFFNGREAK